MARIFTWPGDLSEVIKMEKGIEVIARYHYKHGYFVEVTHEKSVLAGRDYWLCKGNSHKKMFMFSSAFKNEQTEKDMILDNIKENVQRYEQTVSEVLPA